MCCNRMNTANDFEGWLNEAWEPVSETYETFPTNWDPKDNVKFRVLSFYGWDEHNKPNSWLLTDFYVFDIYMKSVADASNLNNKISLSCSPIWRVGSFREQHGPIIEDVTLTGTLDDLDAFIRLRRVCSEFVQSRCPRVDVSCIFIRHTK